MNHLLSQRGSGDLDSRLRADDLRNVISGLHVMAKNRTVTLLDLPRDVVLRPTPALSDAETQVHAAVPGGPVALKDNEALVIRAALNAHHGNLSRAASVLGISRPTLYRKMQTYSNAGRKSG